MHALEPGHGKSFIASYMLGQKLKVRGLASMLGSLLVSHFLLLTVLAIVVKYVFDGISQEHVMSVQEWVAPAIIFGFGLYLFIRYRRHGHSHSADCNCGHHDHNHQPKGPIDVTGLTLDGQEPHTHSEMADKGKNPALVGFITGLIPCPSALAPVLLSATASFSNVLWLIGVYVIGMIVVLTAFVAAFFIGRNVFGGWLENIGQRVNLNLLSAVLIMIVGVAYFTYGMYVHMDPEHVHMHAGHVH